MNNVIFDQIPGTWEELEKMVFQAFQEMGYKAKRNFNIRTIRGNVKVDIHAIKESSPIPTIVLCECKYWDKAVEQNVVYSFRTICADIGAHYGLIISKKGVQKGAKETREATNIHLLDFNEFQQTFFEEWREGICMSLSRMCNRFMKLLSPKYIQSTVEKELFNKYSIFLGANRFTSYFIENGKFPMEVTDPRGSPDQFFIIRISSHREYLEIAKEAFLCCELNYVASFNTLHIPHYL